MKYFYTIVSLLIVLTTNFSAKDIDLSSLPKLLGSSNMGKEFYFTFIPAWENSQGDNDLKIYISSNVKTNVTVEVVGKNYTNSKETIPNDIIEFVLTPAKGQVYRKSPTEEPQLEDVWVGAAVHIYSDDPIICYGVTRYQYSSDGFLILPVNVLGNEYIVASYEDVGFSNNQWLTSYTGISAVYDSTKVSFKMGGTEWSRTVGGQLPGQSSNWNLNRGDVLLIGSLGSNSDLSGSLISSTKPVSVVSGNFCAYVPSNCGYCDVLEEMEFPTQSWGNEYHVTPIFSKAKNSYIKVFAKDARTKIFRNGTQIGFLRYAGGKLGDAYMNLRAEEGTTRPVVISGDKPIGVTQYNTGQLDDGVAVDPFQMVLSPIEQYQNEILFHTPGFAGGNGFLNNYINLCYEATAEGAIPDDLMFAEVDSGEFEWKKIKDINPNPGQPFYKPDGGKPFYSKTIELPDGGVYKIKADNPFQAYSYGFDATDSYGFPASANLKRISINDSLKPKPAWEMSCKGKVNFDDKVYVIDQPDNFQDRSNIALVLMHSDVSYNYKLIMGEFMPCEDQSVPWKLETVDPGEDAYALLTFADCNGNDTTISIEYLVPKIDIKTDTIITETLIIGESYDFLEHVVNNSDSMPVVLHSLVSLRKDIDNEPQGFSFWDSEGKEELTDTFNPPIIIQPGDSFAFTLRFEPTKEGTIWDSIGFSDSCLYWMKQRVEYKVGSPIIYVSDWFFPPIMVGSLAFGTFTVENIGTVNLEIYDFKGPTIIGEVSGRKIYESSELIDANISEYTPLRIKPKERREFNIKFTPDSSRSFPDSIVFISNTIKSESYNDGNKIDSIAIINGTGVKSEFAATSYNWGRKRIDRPGIFPIEPYPAVRNEMNPDTAIRIYNDGTAMVSVIKLTYTDIVGDTSSFKFDRAKFYKTLSPGKEEIIEVKFQPTTPGLHKLTIKYETNPKIENATTTLQGTGIVPRISVNDIDFGKTDVNDFDNSVSKTFTLRNQDSIEWEFGDVLSISDLSENNIYPDYMANWGTFQEPFRYNKFVNDSFAFPIVLQPGETFDFGAGFVAKEKGMFKGYLTTISDAETDVTSEWTGYDSEYIIDVRDFEDNTKLNVYPNPSQGLINISGLNENSKVIIFNLLGEILFESYIHDNYLNIDLSIYSKGIYIVKILGINSMFVDKIILY